MDMRTIAFHPFSKGQIMNIALLQFNPILGHFRANAQTIIQAASEAKQQGAQMLITPPLSLCGFPPAALTQQQSFFSQLQQALADIQNQVEIAVVVGHLQQQGNHLFQAASVYANGQCLFNNARYPLYSSEAIESGDIPVWTFHEHTFALLYPQDMHHQAPVADVAIVLDNTPFYLHRQQAQQQIASEWTKKYQQSLLWVRADGAQDDLIFGGASFAVNPQGQCTFQSDFCQTALEIIQWNQSTFSGSLKTYPCEEEALYRALVCALRDYARKCGFSRLCLGLSGGIDSALVLALAVEAVGAEHCEVLLMPSRYTAQLSNTAAEKMAQNLGVRYQSIPISPVFDAFQAALSTRFAGLPEDVTEENLQARIRGTLLMALSNKSGAMLLSTGNKSETAMGYATLYGDMNGGFSPLKDVLKTQVYAISRWLNAHHKREIIPQEIIDRAPSAELRADQTDQDSLPEYAILDQMIVAILEDGNNAHTLMEQGFAQEDVQRTLKLLQIGEYKRRQGALGPKVSPSLFGTDWHLPICQQFDFQ